MKIKIIIKKKKKNTSSRTPHGGWLDHPYCLGPTRVALANPRANDFFFFFFSLGIGGGWMM
jgi:hypothetical protein